LAGALPISLSPIAAYSDGDGASLTQYANAGLVNVDHLLFKMSFSKSGTEAVYAGLSPMDADTCGDETGMHLESPQSLVNIAHIRKVKRRRIALMSSEYSSSTALMNWPRWPLI
jgi:hypothetical protein